MSCLKPQVKVYVSYLDKVNNLQSPGSFNRTHITGKSNVLKVCYNVISFCNAIVFVYGLKMFPPSAANLEHLSPTQLSIYN